jgi:hypothetical protein
LRQRLDNAVSSSRDRTFPIEATLTMIQTLIDCDEFQDIATLRVIFCIVFEILIHKFYNVVISDIMNFPIRKLMKLGFRRICVG